MINLWQKLKARLNRNKFKQNLLLERQLRGYITRMCSYLEIPIPKLQFYLNSPQQTKDERTLLGQYFVESVGITLYAHNGRYHIKRDIFLTAKHEVIHHARHFYAIVIKFPRFFFTENGMFLDEDEIETRDWEKLSWKQIKQKIYDRVQKRD